MGKVRFEISVSLDGYVAGPNQSVDNPLGEGGEALHEWLFGLEAWRRSHGREGGEANASTEVMEEYTQNVGATIMGRNMFGGHPGPWDAAEPWKGWWGEEPPFHMPVFVLTHHRREPLEMEGGTTFHFVGDGIESALAQAREAAGGEDVKIAGGAEVARQYLAAGLVEEMQLSVVPLLLGGGEGLFEGLGPSLRLEQLRAIEAPGVTHLKYRVLS